MQQNKSGDFTALRFKVPNVGGDQTDLWSRVTAESFLEEVESAKLAFHFADAVLENCFTKLVLPLE